MGQCLQWFRQHAIRRLGDSPGQLRPRRLACAEEALEYNGGDLWVFAYGALMWNSGDGTFQVGTKQPAVLRGYRRSFCVKSNIYRGTPDFPGLVLGLEEHGSSSASGAALCVPASTALDTLMAMDAQEMRVRPPGLLRPVYERWMLPVDLSVPAPGVRMALCYAVDKGNPQGYAGDVPLEQQLARMRDASGERGPNYEYVLNVCNQLEAIGHLDSGMRLLRDRLQEMVPKL